MFRVKKISIHRHLKLLPNNLQMNQIYLGITIVYNYDIPKENDSSIFLNFYKYFIRFKLL
jgi:hypothetical protein